ncbi:UDP-N-acetylglucosamine 4,6-dehydratase (inverting), partial [Alphaproteobacteria bacterium]|nr:UDP-N-acetylglucosamine 4,6-dehydratase (inverting) [Alphaproteobacteria bacterium]
GGVKVAGDFTYSSDTNSEWMTIETLREWIDQNRSKVGKI